jgi:hypothetical protein
MSVQSGTMLVQERIRRPNRDRLVLSLVAAGGLLIFSWIAALLGAAWRLVAAVAGLGVPGWALL